MTGRDSSTDERGGTPASSGRTVAVGLTALLLGVAAGHALARAGAGAPADPDTRIGQILTLPDSLERTEELASLLSRAGSESLDAIRSAFESAALDGGDTDVVLFVEWWTAFDPEAAWQWAQAPGQRESLELAPAVLRVWARSDPAEALERAQGTRDQVQLSLATEAVLIGWDESPIPGVVDYVYRLKDPARLQAAIPIVARRRVASLGSLPALRWAEALPDDNPTFKTRLLDEVVTAAASIEPEEVARWAEPRIESGARTGLPMRIGIRWVRVDPEAALAWLETLPPGRDRDDGVEESYRDWTTLDAPAAAAWMSERVDEPWLEPAAALYTRSLVDTKPEQAFAIAERFSDPDRRTTTLTQIARRWLLRDWDAAEAWIEASDLPEGIRKRAYMVRGRLESKAGTRKAARE